MFLGILQEIYFPRLTRDQYRVTSKQTPDYNCINYAAGHQDAWWWPDPVEGVAWPDGLPVEETLEAFIELYASIGYSVCDGSDLEEGYEKVAIYTDTDNCPTHAARQLESGAWTSKLGEWEDIEHKTLTALEAGEGGCTGYGKVSKIMKRKRPDSAQ